MCQLNKHKTSGQKELCSDTEHVWIFQYNHIHIIWIWIIIAKLQLDTAATECADSWLLIEGPC